MKIIILLFSVILSSFNLSAVDYSTLGSGGSWSLDATWSGTGIPDDNTDNVDIANNDSVFLVTGNYTINNLTFSQNGKLYIKIGDTLRVNNVSVLNNADFYIEGAIIISGNITMSPNSTLDIALTGGMQVLGNFVGNNNVAITNDGSMNISGDLYLGPGATLTGAGSVDAATYSGTGTVFGSPIGTLVDGLTYYDGGSGAWPLPIELSFFQVFNTNNIIKLTWQTASEENNHYFIIERSADGISFETIATIAGAGNSNGALNYSYIDKTPLTGTSYYRLKQTDYNGQSETFDPVSVTYFNDKTIHLSPVPTSDVLNVTVDGSMGNASLKIINMLGAVVRDINQLENQSSIDVSNLPKGIYILSIEGGNARYVKQVMIK